MREVKLVLSKKCLQKTAAPDNFLTGGSYSFWASLRFENCHRPFRFGLGAGSTSPARYFVDGKEAAGSRQVAADKARFTNNTGL